MAIRAAEAAFLAAIRVAMAVTARVMGDFATHFCAIFAEFVRVFPCFGDFFRGGGPRNGRAQNRLCKKVSSL
ncbi:hypothetical protein [Crenobacter luteus]|uniref:hypothetical protein n=1 Tax=Crenobacter luteus TaxID=1452487 RepID=UPI0012E7C79B|nr:hypothetical protein [Crenobacter luteus]